jgi:hypothetical protein
MDSEAPIRPDRATSTDSASGRSWRHILDLGRLVIVVLGILIAFSLDSLWSRRKEARETAANLVALRENFRQNGERLDSVAAMLVGVQRAGAELLRIAQSEERAPSADSLGSLVASTFRLASFQPVTSAYDNLIHARNLGLVRDHDLRLALAAFTSQSGWLREVERWQNDQWLLVNQQFLNEHIEVSDLADYWVDEEARALLPRHHVRTEWGAVLGERTFRNIVIQRVVAADDILRTQAALRHHIDTVLTLLDEALERH